MRGESGLGCGLVGKWTSSRRDCLFSTGAVGIRPGCRLHSKAGVAQGRTASIELFLDVLFILFFVCLRKKAVAAAAAFMMAESIGNKAEPSSGAFPVDEVIHGRSRAH